MRNILAHDYEAVKTDRLWDILQHELSPLRENCLRIILTDLGYEYRPEENDDERLPDDEEEI